MKSCTKYRFRALISYLSKVVLNAFQERLRLALKDRHLREQQAGFRKDRSTIQQIFMLRLMAEDTKSSCQKRHTFIVDFRKAFDSSDVGSIGKRGKYHYG